MFKRLALPFVAALLACLPLGALAQTSAGGIGEVPGVGLVVTSPMTLTSSLKPQVGVLLPTSTVATLPTCNAGLKGTLRAVTDATTPTYNGALTGGGAVVVPVLCNGTAWTSH